MEPTAWHLAAGAGSVNPLIVIKDWKERQSEQVFDIHKGHNQLQQQISGRFSQATLSTTKCHKKELSQPRQSQPIQQMGLDYLERPYQLSLV